MKCPYSGQPCLKAKEITVTETRNGEVVRLHLCHDCGAQHIKAPEQEVIAKSSDINFMPSGEVTSTVSTKDMINIPCPKCGTTPGEISDNPEAGCDVCRLWMATVDGLITETKSQHDTSHVKQKTRFKVADQIKLLHERLALAIKKEDYEEAALLRDAIEGLDKRLGE